MPTNQKYSNMGSKEVLCSDFTVPVRRHQKQAMLVGLQGD